MTSVLSVFAHTLQWVHPLKSSDDIQVTTFLMWKWHTVSTVNTFSVGHALRVPPHYSYSNSIISRCSLSNYSLMVLCEKTHYLCKMHLYLTHTTLSTKAHFCVPKHTSVCNFFSVIAAFINHPYQGEILGPQI